MTPPRRPAGSLAIAALLFVAAIARTSHADDAGTDDAAVSAAAVRAQQLLHDGNELFWADRLSEALQLFEEAYRIYPSPKLLFNIARCEEGLDRRTRAVAHYQRFLREQTSGEPLARAEADQHVTALSAALVALEVIDAPANAAIQIDGEPAGLTPLDGPLWLEPGTHRVSIDRPGQPLWITSVEGAAGAKVSVTVPKPEAPPANPGAGRSGGSSASGEGHPDGHPSSRLRRWWWLWAGLGLAVVGGATAVYLMTRCPVSKGTCE